MCSYQMNDRRPPSTHCAASTNDAGESDSFHTMSFAATTAVLEGGIPPSIQSKALPFSQRALIRDCKEANRMTQLGTVDVFVSYHSKDRKTVEAICNNLTQRKLSCYLDIKEFKAGLHWQTQFNAIADKVGAAFIFIGKEGLGEWQEEELRHFHSNSHKWKTNLY
jgi:hypothetical protein